MRASETDVDSPPDVPIAKPELHREGVERVTVRRRRRSKSRHHRHRSWTSRASRRRVLQSVLVCVGVLMLMALGLYLGLSHENAEGSRGTPAIGTAASLG
jgi:hypothetical protein